jgi:hypothetical protein
MSFLQKENLTNAHNFDDLRDDYVEINQACY